MAAPNRPAPSVPSRVSFQAYSDAACTQFFSVVPYGDTVYFNAYITMSKPTTGSTVAIDLYNSSDTFIQTLLDTTYSFPSNTVVSLKDDICGGTAPSLTTSEQGGGRYYVLLSIYGSDVDDIFDRVNTVVPDYPTISSPTISDSTTTFDAGVRITATITGHPDRAYVEFLDAGGEPVYMCMMSLTSTGGSTYSAVADTEPKMIPVGNYGVGKVVIHALNMDDNYIGCTTGDTDSSLSLTVTSSDGLKTGTLRWLNQTVEIKYHTGLDDYGAPTFGSWTNVAARVVRNTQKIIGTDGREIVSTAQTYVSGENSVVANDRLRFDGSDEAVILKTDIIPDADGNNVLKVIYT